MSRRAQPRTMLDYVRRGQALPVMPTTDSGWRRYDIGRQFLPAVTNLSLPEVVPGAVLDLRAHSARGVGVPGTNSPATTTWTDLSGNGNNGTLTNFAYTTASGWGTEPNRLVCNASNGTYVTIPGKEVTRDDRHDAVHHR